jgi:hypothetical protein
VGEQRGSHRYHCIIRNDHRARKIDCYQLADVHSLSNAQVGIVLTCIHYDKRPMYHGAATYHGAESGEDV